MVFSIERLSLMLLISPQIAVVLHYDKILSIEVRIYYKFLDTHFLQAPGQMSCSTTKEGGVETVLIRSVGTKILQSRFALIKSSVLKRVIQAGAIVS